MTDVDVSNLTGTVRPGRPLPIPRLAVKGMSKQYGGIHALADVTFDVAPSEIHALVGENGAGKSTLVKIVTGVVRPDSGTLEINGSQVAFESATQARSAGVTAVYQDSQLFPSLSIAENVFMETFPTRRFGVVDWPIAYSEASRLLNTLGVDLNPKSLVSTLTSAERQFVAMARAISAESQLLILDEPTATITPTEADRLYAVMRRLRDLGSSVLFISHRIEELRGLVDTVTVLRDGRHVATRPEAELDRSEIVSLMVGRKFESLYVRPEARAQVGTERFRVEHLSRTGKFNDVSFSVHAGEVVTLAGLVGSGRSEIAEAVFGVTPATSGQVFINGQPIRVANNRQMLKLGVAYLPEDRDGQGLITQFSIRANVILPILDKLSRFGFVSASEERDRATSYAQSLQVKMSGIDQIVAALSGGNRQKVVLAKWLATDPAVLILDEPTHGIDIATKAQVHELVAGLATRGLAILQISSDLPEVLATSDRILVISEGRLVASFDRDDATQEKIMMAATSAAKPIGQPEEGRL